MDLFLTSSNREIVRSVLGFVKVAIISLPESIVTPRLETLVPGLMAWSREHKAHLRAKVKHIFERAIRRFGFEAIEKHCAEDDKKFVNNIRKTKERAKRHKAEGTQGAAGEMKTEKRKGRFESEYDEALYGSDSSSGSDVGHGSDNEPARNGKRGHSYITEDADEPLDLLDRKSLAHISSRKPQAMKPAPSKQRKNKTDLDGKLILNDADDGDEDDAMALDFDADGNNADVSLEGGINAYVDAIKGRDAVQRGRGGRLKFSNKREKSNGVGDGMDVDDDNDRNEKGGKKQVKFSDSAGVGGKEGKEGRRADRVRGSGKSFSRGRGGIGKRVERRGLGGRSGGGGGGGGAGREVRSGRVMKGGGRR